MQKLSLIAGAAVLSLLVTGCTLQKQAPANEPRVETQEQTTGTAGTGMVESEQKMDMTVTGDQEGAEIVSQESETKVMLKASNFTYGTSKITVKKGSTLILAVTNEKGFHDFKIDELKIDSGMIKEGDTWEVTVPTDTVGSFEYYCSVGEHRANGMKGTLTIVE